MIKIRMYPHISELGNGEGGIHTVVRKYFEYLPNFDIELTNSDTFDLIASHAGMTGAACDVAHLHGLYWTADYPADKWEWRVNAYIVEAVRSAKIITVPSAWVAETLQRDMRLNPAIIPHGIDWQEWQHTEDNQGYVLWNKTRTGDVCDNSVLDYLIKHFPGVKFVSTLPTPQTEGIINTPLWPQNFQILARGGKTPHAEMKRIVQLSGVYLSTAKETGAIGVMEAMAAGVPVLGYKWGVNSDLIKHGVSGYLAEPGNVENLAEGLNYCLKYRAVLGANGRELAKQWTWAAACEKVAGVYRLAMAAEPAAVTVVIPVYNKSPEQLGRAIDSVLVQTGRVSEVIIVNDGSPNTADIEGFLSGHYDNRNIKYISQPNQGVAIARNTGIAAASTKYILCLDADDWIDPAFVEVCVKALETERSLGIAYTGLMTHNSDGAATVSQWPGQFDANKQLAYPKQNQVPTACVFRREAWQRVGGYKQRYAPNGAGSEDAAFWSAVCSIGYNAKKVTDEPLFHYSAHGGQVHGNQGYSEVDWLSMYPWAADKQHPFASVAPPKKHSHPVRQYDEPIVSVIIPVGPGHEAEVQNALDSLEMQYFRKWEAIVVNDTGKSLELAAYPYARVAKTSGKRGAGAARNVGASIARAPLLLFLDADDVLASSDAIGKMVEAWNGEQAIIYTDYLGKAIWNEGEARRVMGDDLLEYNKKTSAAVFKKRSADYDSSLAQRQPEFQRDSTMPYYHWCLVSVLLPKIWHDAIGGYDEAMPTWEDVDYHWRLARAGYCYYRLPETLVLYNYHKGYRREASQGDRQKINSIVQYVKSKEEYQKEPVGCNCGKRQQPNNSTTIIASQVSMIADDTMVLVEFDFPGSNVRQTYGKALTSPTNQTGLDGRKLDYKGYSRKKGDRFLVHTADQKARPDMFRLVKSDVVLPEQPKASLPEPQLI